MKSREQLIQDAEECERLAAIVSLRTDKEAFLKRARELRRQAERISPESSKPAPGDG